ncbi:unnamed protein product [Lathyrus sativus]|nr:unnamed protein product [Lathyrus sativus]
MADIYENERFKKFYMPPVFEEKSDETNLDEEEAVVKDSQQHVTENKKLLLSMNAFELIAMSKALNFENLLKSMLENSKPKRKRKLNLPQRCFTWLK